MLRIKIPVNFSAERNYIIDILFSELLSLPYTIETHNKSEYSISFNSSEIIFLDHFFSHFSEENGYLNTLNIPQKVLFTKNDFTPEPDIPIIYGDEVLVIEKNKIICGIDIFASSFFMLSRWEEHIIKKRDHHHRFFYKDSLAYKNHFLQRPVVNEYAFMLLSMLSHLEYNQTPKHQGYQVFPTHDIDRVIFPSSIKYFFADFSYYKNIVDPIKTRYNYFFNKNYTDIFDWLIDLSDKNNLQSIFYFMNNGHNQFDSNYKIDEPFISHRITKIANHNHIIGYHPGYKTYLNPIEWERQYKGLSKKIKTPVKEVRQHYLQFEVPNTWQIYEDQNIEIDSTMCYSGYDGFRCGTASVFSVFNILSQKKLKLKERPLIYMEAQYLFSLEHGVNLENSVPLLHDLKNKCKKYFMPFTLLFHPINFNVAKYHKWTRFQEIYLDAISR